MSIGTNSTPRPGLTRDHQDGNGQSGARTNPNARAVALPYLIEFVRRRWSEHRTTHSQNEQVEKGRGD